MNSHDADHARLIAKHVLIASSNPPNERDAYLEFSPVDTDAGDFNRNGSHHWSATAGTEIVNPMTGEITIVPPRRTDKRECLTVPKLASKLAIGPRQAKALLLSMGLLQTEVVVKHSQSIVSILHSKPEYSHEHRLSEWAAKMAYGIRVKSPRGFDFDLITEPGVRYIEEMVSLRAALCECKEKRGVKPKAIVATALQADPTLRVVDIVRMTGLPQPTVWRHAQAIKKAAGNDGLASRSRGGQQGSLPQS